MKKLFSGITISIALVVGGVILLTGSDTPLAPQEEREQRQNQSQLQRMQEMARAWEVATLEGVEILAVPPEITGDEMADERIRSLAEARGQELQPVALTSRLKEIDGVRLNSEAAGAWEELKESARQSDVQLELKFGYRSVEEQRELFLEEFEAVAINQIGRPYTSAQIAGGTADAAINAVLREHAIPGYSSRHTGYILGIANTAESRQWLEADEFKHPLETGFIPSLSLDSSELSILEYIWVGTDIVSHGA